ncbi:hypothetical protein DVH24_038352 [Malus domestica]|uniref:Uncharacterized protein n=1 Tax=Malus domestica TaxID=3750 RepID=A0A498K9G1_MALDO|nr:hypothetical protein DVH24_038352 [Malus domestica]
MYQLLEGVEALPELLGNLTCLIGLTIRNYKKLMNLSSAKVMQRVATLLSQRIKQSEHSRSWDFLVFTDIIAASLLDLDITHESLRGIFSFMEPTLPQPSAVAGNAVEDINFYGLGNKNGRGEVHIVYLGSLFLMVFTHHCLNTLEFYRELSGREGRIGIPVETHARIISHTFMFPSQNILIWINWQTAWVMELRSWTCKQQPNCSKLELAAPFHQSTPRPQTSNVD